MDIPNELQGKVQVPLWPDAAHLLGIRSRHAAYRAAREGRIPTLRVANRYTVPVAPLLKMLGLDSPRRSA